MQPVAGTMLRPGSAQAPMGLPRRAAIRHRTPSAKPAHTKYVLRIGTSAQTQRRRASPPLSFLPPPMEVTREDRSRVAEQGADLPAARAEIALPAHPRTSKLWASVSSCRILKEKMRKENGSNSRTH